MYVIERVIIHLWLSPISELYSNFLNLREIQRLWNVKVLVAQSLPTLCGPMDYVAPGSPVHGIFQARILEWVALPFSRGSSAPRNETWSPALQGTLSSEPPGKPHTTHLKIVKMENLCCVGFATFLKMLSTDPLRKIPKFFFSFLSPTLFQWLKVVLHSNSWILLPTKNAL